MEILALGISTAFSYAVPFSQMIEFIGEAGFGAVALGGEDVGHSGYDTPQGRDTIRKALDDNGLVLDSIHAPFGAKRDISSQERVVRRMGCTRVKDAVLACQELGSTVAVVHLNSQFPDSEFEKRLSAAKKSLEELIPYAERLGVTLAAENDHDAQSMVLFDRVMSSYPELDLCYDSSHAYLYGTYLGGQPFEMLRTYADRVGAVHLSDGRRNVDDHLLLYEGKIEWNEFVAYFSATRYMGSLLLEVEMGSSEFTDPAAFLRRAYAGATELLKMIEEGGE